MRTRLLTLIALTLAWPVGAQPTTPPGVAFEFKTVAEALASLEARDGNGTVVTHPEGWVVINEHAAAAQWSFVPKDHAAYPAVVRRVIRRTAGQPVSVETSSLCEAPKEQCTKLLEEFANLNDRVTQSVRARSRQGSTQP